MSSPSAPTVSISLTCKSAADALTFYTKAFGAKELFRMSPAPGVVAHAEFMIGNTHLMISDESPEWHAKANPEGTMASCIFAIDIENCDEAFAKAVACGATPLREPQTMFWGRRSGIVCDPFGYRWNFSQLVEEVSPEEMMKRAQAFMGASK